MSRLRTILPLLLPFAAIPALAQKLDPETEKKLDEVFAPWNVKDQPGGVAGVYMDGKLVYSKGFGLANLEHGVPLTADSVMDIGSVSKHFTATCILLLQEEGKLNLDDEVQTHIKELPKFSKPITLRQLMNHTSGLRDYFTLFALKGWNMLDTLEMRRVLDLLHKQRDLNFEPNTSWNYCNTGYLLLGEVVARTSGKPLATYAKENIFDKLGMENTRFHASNVELVKNRAQSYTKGGGTQYFALNSSLELIGDGGVLTTLADMAKWDSNFNKNKLGKGDSDFFAPMLVTAKLSSGADTKYGGGLFIDEYKGVKRISHGGDWLAFSAQYSRYPEHKISICTFGNDGTQLAKSMNAKAAEVLLSKFIKAEPAPGELRAVPLEMPKKEAIVGRWMIKGVAPMTLRLEGPALRLQVDGQPALPLLALEETKFFINEPRVEITFEKDADGKINKGHLKQGPANFELTRMEDFKPSDELFSSVEGLYYSTELDLYYRLSRNGDNIKLSFEGQDIDFMTFESDKKLNGQGVQADIVRDDSGKVVALLFQAGRALNLRFDRAIR